MYLRTIAVLLWPVWLIITVSVAPLAAAAVASPALRE